MPSTQHEWYKRQRQWSVKDRSLPKTAAFQRQQPSGKGTWSMAWRMATWPVMAATCKGVEPAGADTSDMTSKSTVRTIMEAPPSSSRRTHSRLPFTAAKCRAVRPFSARLSIYLRTNQRCELAGMVCARLTMHGRWFLQCVCIAPAAASDP